MQDSVNISNLRPAKRKSETKTKRSGILPTLPSLRNMFSSLRSYDERNTTRSDCKPQKPGAPRQVRTALTNYLPFSVMWKAKVGKVLFLFANSGLRSRQLRQRQKTCSNWNPSDCAVNSMSLGFQHQTSGLKVTKNIRKPALKDFY